ncbi:ubiquinol oxidase subunit II [Paenibacillus sp. HB172176]|uniref:ubiquinol oxidase subunit II n=1 Tax=Paenibacillus sp. HB172176 TaxID=2493690 RepID=UPI001F111FF6|nr:ubiquinol oxidase subunit II [Paenibacillus sp. HB172176]
MLTAAVFLAMVTMLSGCSGDYIVLDPKGPIGESQKDLIIISTLLCAVIIVPVLILTAFIVWRYRDRPGSKAPYKPNWAHNTKLEVVWWGIPIIVIIILAAVTVVYTYKLEPSKEIASTEKPITIQVVSLDWKWLFKYPGEDIATVNYLKIPEDTPIRFELTSDTAMNSFWIPQLGGQIYTMSGMAMTLYLQADEQGSYYGSGANFTGKEFAKMTFKTDAVSREDYDAWVKDVKSNAPALTMDGFDTLRQPGSSDVQLFSSSPEDLFYQVAMQYIPEGSSGMHMGHSMDMGAMTEGEKKLDSDPSADMNKDMANNSEFEEESPYAEGDSNSNSKSDEQMDMSDMDHSKMDMSGTDTKH